MKYFYLCACFFLAACQPSEEISVGDGAAQSELSPGIGGYGDFKVPVPPGHHWEVTQSWSSHCEACAAKYSDWDYCILSHTGNCCEYSWDFNLPGGADNGKSVLASGAGVVKLRKYNSGWGNYVVIDHGNNICSLSAHMLDGSTSHLSVGDEVCQGMIIGKIGDTGASEGEHLHFQFQACDTGETLAMGFSDGNGVPICTRGNDVFDEDGKYDFLILDNAPVVSCGGGASEDPVFDDEGWLDGECGPLSGCPMQPDCDRSTDHQFSDWYKLTAITEKASTYLWSECALDGKSDGSFSPLDHITKAEALKVSLLLFGLLEDCPGGDIDWEDLDGDEWQQPVLNCAVLHGILPDALEVLTPNEEISFAEAVKYAVMPAVSRFTLWLPGASNA